MKTILVSNITIWRCESDEIELFSVPSDAPTDKVVNAILNQLFKNFFEKGFKGNLDELNKMMKLQLLKPFENVEEAREWFCANTTFYSKEYDVQELEIK